jgi:hypothetical protein
MGGADRGSPRSSRRHHGLGPETRARAVGALEA